MDAIGTKTAHCRSSACGGANQGCAFASFTDFYTLHSGVLDTGSSQRVCYHDLAPSCIVNRHCTRLCVENHCSLARTIEPYSSDAQHDDLYEQADTPAVLKKEPPSAVPPVRYSTMLPCWALHCTALLYYSDSVIWCLCSVRGRHCWSRMVRGAGLQNCIVDPLSLSLP